MRPRDVVQAWIEAFNRADVDALAALYHADAIDHQVAEKPVEGRDAIRAMFAAGFGMTEMTCIPENLFEDGAWAILEWRDPKGLHGCGFFHVIDGRIAFQSMSRKSGPTFPIRTCSKTLRWRVFLSIRRFRLIGIRARGYWDKLSFLRLHGLPQSDEAN